MRHLATLFIATTALGATLAGCGDDSTEEQSANATQATVHHFECETRSAMDDGIAHSLRFSVRALERTGEIDIIWPEDEDELAVVASPDDSYLDGLNENIVLYHEDGKLIISGDSDGFYLSKLVLYEDSGYTKGYVTLDDIGGVLDGDQYSKLDCAVHEDKPRYTLADEHLLGYYSGDDYCPGGFSACDGAELVKTEGGAFELELGGGDYWDGYYAELRENNGVLLFTTGDRYESDGPDFDDCDDPGCGNVLTISGVLYPRKVDGQWVPTIKAYYSIDFPFPDEEEAPEGILKHVSHLAQQP